jgi:hypothetical protein
MEFLTLFFGFIKHVPIPLFKQYIVHPSESLLHFLEYDFSKMVQPTVLLKTHILSLEEYQSVLTEAIGTMNVPRVLGGTSDLGPRGYVEDVIIYEESFSM